MEELLGLKEGESESLCMRPEPTHTQESKAMVGVKATRSFQAVSQCFSKNSLGEKKINKNNR